MNIRCESAEHLVQSSCTIGANLQNICFSLPFHLLFSPFSSSFNSPLIVFPLPSHRFILSSSLPTPFLPTRYIRISKYLHTQISLYLCSFIFRYLHTPILTYPHSSLFKSSNTSQYLTICISLNIQIQYYITRYFSCIIRVYIQISRPIQV